MFNSLLQYYKSSLRLKQITSLFTGNILALPVGIITSIIITRFLGAESYGDYKFILSIFNFAVVIFTFGFYHAGDRALILNHNKQKAKEYYGTELLITAGLFLLMSILLIIYTRIDNNIQEKQLSSLFLYLIPFSWIFLMVQYLEILLNADNKIGLLAQVKLYPKLVFLLAISSVFFIVKPSNYHLLIVCYFFFISESIIYLLILLKLKVSFKNIKVNLKKIFSYNKTYGFNVYIGSLFSLGMASLSEILISYFSKDNTGVGFYSLALTLSMPLAYIPKTVASSYYRSFSNKGNVPPKVIAYTLMASLLALVLLWLLIAPSVRHFYGKTFEPVIALNYIVSMGILMHSFGDLFNRFLAANGQGKSIRNSLVIYGLAILTSNILLIPNWGAKGAAWAKLLSGIVYLTIILFYYYKHKNCNVTK